MSWIYSLVTFFLWFAVTFGEDDSTACSPFCVLSTSGATCNNITGECLLGCQPGYAGPNCNIQCCSNCKNCTLKQGSLTSIVCHQCADNYYRSGDDCVPCNTHCTQNTSSLQPVCRQTDGFCEFGCKTGYTGTTCMQSCSDACKEKECDRFNGSCTMGCKLHVLRGPTCSETCSEGCDGRECNQSGTCLKGCLGGYWGSLCSVTCPENCFKPTEIDSRTCNETSGVCLHGCVNSTHWGNNCTDDCSATCLNQRCEFETSNCIDGCIQGHKGPTCLEKVEAPDETKTILIAVFVPLGVVVLVVIVIIIYCKLRK